MPTLLVVDPGYEIVLGHHHAVNAMLLDKLPAAGWQVKLLGNRLLGAEGHGDRVLRSNMYKSVKSAGELVRWSGVSNQLLFEDLEKHAAKLADQTDLILVHTCFHAMLFGLVDWILAMRARSVMLPLRLHFLFPNASEFGNIETADLSDLLLEQAIRYACKSGMEVRLSAETPSLAAMLGRWSQREVPVVLSPKEIPAARAITRTVVESDPVTFLYIGQLRTEKGAVLLLSALTSILEAVPQANLRFVVPELPGNVLKKLQDSGSRVSFRVEGLIDEAEYFEEIRNADYVLCLYSPRAYRSRASAIFFDALAAGTPVVCTPGIGALEHLNELTRTAVEVSSGSTLNAIIESLKNAVTNRQARRRASMRARDEVVQQLKSSRWIDAMLN